MFKFNFSKEDDKTAPSKSEGSKMEWIESCEVIPQKVPIDDTNINVIRCGDVVIDHLGCEEVVRTIKERTSEDSNRIIKAEEKHSDLIPALYEGGLKIWECTYDLLEYLNTNNINFQGNTVLDLGCGAGIIGIFCILKGAEKCCFQDYNVEVINAMTIPNVLLNKTNFEGCKFYSGDWESFSQNLDEKFDYIFTSETIYNTENYVKLLAVFKNLLADNGTIFVAAKHHYFGVGGGISQFEDMLQDGNTFDVTTCWDCTDGFKRTILKIEFKKQ